MNKMRRLLLSKPVSLGNIPFSGWRVDLLHRLSPWEGYIECTFRQVGKVTSALASAEEGDIVGFRALRKHLPY